jgi:hypothetical protein
MNNDLYFEHLKGQAQFAYFQLGVAASAIAFAVHETKGQALSDTPWPIGLGTALWAVSFAVGCFGMQARQRGMATNLRYNEFIDAYRSDVTNHDAMEVFANAKAIAQEHVERPRIRFRWQQWTMFAGALAYIAGHVMQMAEVAPGSNQPPQKPASVNRPKTE